MENLAIYVPVTLAGLGLLIAVLKLFKDKTKSTIDNMIHDIAVKVKDAIDGDPNTPPPSPPQE